MKISAKVQSSFARLATSVMTDDQPRSLVVPSKESGNGSAVNGGELLLLALATCFCNDIYREAAKRNMEVHEVEVIASAEFGAAGEPGRNFQYSTHVKADATDEEIKELIMHTDKVAEIHNTLRQGVEVNIKMS